MVGNKVGCERWRVKGAAASPATKAGPSAPPSAISATPATRNEVGCDQAPRLPRETKVDVSKCHACHAKLKRVCGRLLCVTGERWWLTKMVDKVVCESCVCVCERGCVKDGG